jgi:hypothetical protein
VVPEEPVSQPSFEEGLLQIGLEAEWLRAAVGNGNLERTRVLGSHNAPSAQGFYAWNGVLASLTRTVQAAQDFNWERRNPQCLPVLIERNKKNILFISSGDEYTGLGNSGRRYPRSRNPKGAIVAALANQNKKLMEDYPGLFPAERPKADEYELMQELVGCTTYVLLVHFSKRDVQARYEVSRLEDANHGGCLSVRYPRWIAPAYPLTVEDFSTDDPNEGFDGPPEFPVSPKS